MMRKLVVFGMLAAILLTSCKKDEDSNPVTTYPDYAPLTVGSYWIYANYSYDTAGVETDLHKEDSVVVTHDTVINGRTYAVLEGSYYAGTPPWLVLGSFRDSLHYLVNEKGEILFSSQNFTDTLYQKIEYTWNGDTLYHLYYMMQNVAQAVSVPAGSFEVLDFQGTINNPALPDPLITHDMYAEGIGKVLETRAFLSGYGGFKRKLVRYHIAP